MVNQVDVNVELFKNFCNQRNEANKRKAMKKKYGRYRPRFKRSFYTASDDEYDWDDMTDCCPPEEF